jgi:hypothetical protein
METEADVVTLRCEACGASIPVRRFDAEWQLDPRTSRGLAGRIRRVR